jgi:DNA-binding beta-propeller fold protein YncE
MAFSPFAAPPLPFSVAVDPSGEFVYVAGTDSNELVPYSIDDRFGFLTEVPPFFATGSKPVSLAIDSKAEFAYVANSLDNTLSAYIIDNKNGSLIPVPGSPFAAGDGPVSVAVDPTGKFAYVVNQFSNNVSAYRIAANGALTPVTNSPFAAGSGPGSVAIAPLAHFAASFTTLEIEKHRFDLFCVWTTSGNLVGINPLTENVTLQVGTFSVMIPADSFNHFPEGSEFVGVINGVSLRVVIWQLDNNSFTFAAGGIGVDLTGLTNPVTVVLTTGLNIGTTTISPRF